MSQPLKGNTGTIDLGDARVNVVEGGIASMDYFYAASTGQINGVRGIIKFGHNPDIDTAAGEDINYFGNLTYLTAASTFDVVSDSSADDLTTGTGAWEITISYLDANYAEQTETISLDGLTPVTTTGSGLRLLSAYCGKVGSGGVNAGNIAITATTGGTTQAYIPANKGQTQQAAYTVPAGYTAHFVGGLFSIDETAGGALKEATAFVHGDIRLYDENSTNNYQSWRTLFQTDLNNRGTGALAIPQTVTNPIPEKTDVRIRAEVGVNDTEVTARLFIILREN